MKSKRGSKTSVWSRDFPMNRLPLNRIALQSACASAAPPLYRRLPLPEREPGRTRSSAGEHLVDIEGVTGSIPVASTIFLHIPTGSSRSIASPRGYLPELALAQMTGRSNKRSAVELVRRDPARVSRAEEFQQVCVWSRHRCQWVGVGVSRAERPEPRRLRQRGL